MDRNNNNIKYIAQVIQKLKDETQIESFIRDLLTETEIETLSKRWCILNMLANGQTQREISKNLGVSLCKVTRGSKILKNKDSVITKFLYKEK